MKFKLSELKKIIKQEINKILISESNSSGRPELIFLIGPPAIGKSTYIQEHYRDQKKYIVVNRDEIVEKIASQLGIGTYDDMYTSPPNDLLKMVKKEITADQLPNKTDFDNKIDNYILELNRILKKYKQTSDLSIQEERFGTLVPYSKERLKQLIVDWGNSPEHIKPFEWSKIKTANDNVQNELIAIRKNAAIENKSIIIDMVNMRLGERDGHRKAIADALNIQKDDLNNYFTQKAVVFSGNNLGYSDEEKKLIKGKSIDRSNQLREQGKNKTIPFSAYDGFFNDYIKPTITEFPGGIIEAGLPFIDKFVGNKNNEKKRLISLYNEEMERLNQLTETIKSKVKNLILKENKKR